jgi:mannose-6-phosphate isomerase
MKHEDCGPVPAERVDKPWGHEIIWAHTDRYAGKILHVRAGHRLSLQFHRRKAETMRVLSGLLELEVQEEGQPARTVRLAAGDGWHLPAGVRHRTAAIEDTVILEVSSPELDDLVRVADDHGRLS